MNKRFSARGKTVPTVPLLIAIVLLSSWMAAHPVTASGAQPWTGESQLAAPTSTPVTETATNPARGSPLIGILVLLAPLVYIAWKSRGVKEPKITASCCLPVIDGDKRPFAIPDDSPDAGSSIEK